MTEPRTGDEGPPGIIDTIGYAFALLNRRPYLIWVPVLVDLLAWTGLRLRLTGGVQVENQLAGGGDSIPVERLSNIEFINFATWPIPRLLDQGPFSDVPSPVDLPDVATGTGAGLVLLLAGLVISTLLLTGWAQMIARLVVDAPATDLSWLWKSPIASVRFVFATLASVALIGFLAIPFLLAAGGLHLLSVSPIGLLTLSILLLTGWLGLFFLFSLPAIVISDAPVADALRASYQLVLNNFLAVIGLLIIVMLVRVATPHALSVFADSPWSIPFAIIVNAYIVTGLLAAILLFYQDRSSFEQTSSAVSPAATS